MRRYFAAALVFVPGLLLLVFSACGNSGSPSPTSTATGSSTSTATGIPTVSGTPTATATVTGCTAGLRQLVVANGSNEPVWVAGGGGALRAVCVVDSTTSCLPSKFNASSCQCGTTAGTLSCPGTSTAGNGGQNCSCATDSDCGSGAGCNPNTKLCYFELPQPTDFNGFTPSNPWNWEIPAAGESVTFCLSQSQVSFQSGTIGSPVWWSGGVAARTGCQTDGTQCLTGDCNAQSNSNCSAGVGPGNPTTIAEFTLQTTATDFYDITTINGANIGEQMGPIPTATQTPNGVDPSYWCSTPGGDCKFDFGTYTRNVPLPSPSKTTDYTTLLMHTTQPCTVGPTNEGCPTGAICHGVKDAVNGVCSLTCKTNSDCPGGLQCLTAGDNNSYCQCTGDSNCSAGQFCGTQFVPGLGDPKNIYSPQVYMNQCGSFAGWWSADDFCGNGDNIVGNPASPVLNCRAGIADGDPPATTNLSSLFGCTVVNPVGPGGAPGNPANATSCYNSGASPNTGCCGCATDPANPLAPNWPAATGECANNNPTWASSIQPWLVNLKKACPTAYSYPFDDFTSTFQCQAQGSTNMLGYTVTFTTLPPPASETPVPAFPSDGSF